MSARLRLDLSFYGPGGGVLVDLDDDMGQTVVVTFQPEATEEPTSRHFGPDEARALAAALLHFATEAER